MKTFVSNLFAASTLTAFIATSIPSVSAVALTSDNHVARHLNLAHAAKVRRNAHKKRCKTRPAAQADPKTGGGGTTTNNGGSTTNNGGSSGGGGGGGGAAPGLGGKRGLAFPMGCGDLDKWQPNSKIHWHYNWRPTPYGDCPQGLPPFIPMFWGWPYEQAFDDAVRNWTPPYALFVNEPNLGGDLSSGISPGDAVGLWYKHMMPLRQRGTRIGSAATTSAPDGVTWQQEFERICGSSDCTPDFDCIHYYDTSVEAFIAYATHWHTTFGRNIWVTEMACQNFNGGAQCDMGQIYDFVGRITHWCETTDWIEAYTFFGAMSDVQNVNYLDKMTQYDGVTPNDLGYFMLSAT